MKRRIKKICFGIGIFLLILLCEVSVKASSVEELIGEMDFSEISGFLEEQEEVPISFEEMVQAILGMGQDLLHHLPSAGRFGVIGYSG